VVSHRSVFRVHWVGGGGGDEGLYKGGDRGVVTRDGSTEIGMHTGAFVGEEEGGGGGYEGLFECRFEGGEERGSMEGQWVYEWIISYKERRKRKKMALYQT